METVINGNRLRLLTGDITKQETEAIVNAANGSLMGGGGVDGAIHRAAGPGLLAACRRIRETDLDGEELATGQAVITEGYNLPAKFVIHTVGPIWRNSGGEEALLSDCYENSLELAMERGLRSISFPSVSTGVYGFPVDRAARTALRTILRFLTDFEFGEVVLVLFSEEDYKVYETALKELLKEEDQ